WQSWRAAHAPSALIYVGKGHNGGDALVAARALHEAGARIVLRFAHPLSDHAPLTAKMLRRVSASVPRTRVGDSLFSASTAAPFDWLIDGLLGLNASGALRAAERAACCEINLLRRSRRVARVIAVDVPSGLDADSGSADADAVCADVTLTVGFPKRGML